MQDFDKKLLERIGKKLSAKKQTVAVAESVTTGLLQWAIASIPDAKDFFQGGMTTYNLGQKYKHLAVEPIHAEACDCVSSQVAEQMALNVSKNFCSDWGIAITGYATPVPESGNKLFAFFAIAVKGKIKSKGKLTAIKSDPSKVQAGYVENVLQKFISIL
jgi:nicotinamide-nucleotide amidase